MVASDLLLAFEDAKAAIQALLLEGVEFGGEVGERIAAHDRSLTTSNERQTAND